MSTNDLLGQALLPIIKAEIDSTIKNLGIDEDAKKTLKQSFDIGYLSNAKKIIAKVLTVDLDDPKEVNGKCSECGGDMIEKEGRFGKFLGCSNYPDCDHTKKFVGNSTVDDTDPFNI